MEQIGTPNVDVTDFDPDLLDIEASLTLSLSSLLCRILWGFYPVGYSSQTEVIAAAAAAAS